MFYWNSLIKSLNTIKWISLAYYYVQVTQKSCTNLKSILSYYFSCEEMDFTRAKFNVLCATVHHSLSFVSRTGIISYLGIVFFRKPASSSLDYFSKKYILTAGYSKTYGSTFTWVFIIIICALTKFLFT